MCRKILILVMCLCTFGQTTLAAAVDSRLSLDIVKIYQAVNNASLSTMKVDRETLLEKLNDMSLNTQEGEESRDKVVRAIEKGDNLSDVLTSLEKQTKQFEDGQKQIKDVFGSVFEEDMQIKELTKKEFSWNIAFPELKDIRKGFDSVVKQAEKLFQSISSLWEG